MTEKEILELARECKIINTCYDGVPLGPHNDFIIAFAKAIAHRTREECADLAWEYHNQGPEAVDLAIRDKK